MTRKYKFDYDFENDDLFIYNSKAKAKASIEMGNLIIDYDSKKEVSAIELIDASEFFNDISSEIKITKEKLRAISECKVDLSQKKGFLRIKFSFTLKNKEKLYAPIMIPALQKSSPATVA